MDVNICVGSSCHLKGSYSIIHVFQELISQYHLEDQVELKASFCLGHCTDGVATMINGELVDHVSPENAVEIFHKYVLEPLQK
ncbi:MAG: NAD(P)H-dependent oxidoreductase subunit E [Candidatus Merdivicinus sp.]|jgi:NADH:ubiquinone oxidoreductase subunit E